MATHRAPCSDVSREAEEPLAATASRVSSWLLVEYRGLWAYDAVAGSALSEDVKLHLRDQVARLPAAKLLFLRRTERRAHPELTVYFARSTERDRALACVLLERYEELLALDFTGAVPPGEPID